MGSTVSLRRSWEERVLASGLLSSWWRGRGTVSKMVGPKPPHWVCLPLCNPTLPFSSSPERCCSAPRTLRHHLETSLWGAASDRRGWRRKPRPLPPPSFSLWVAGDGGTWEENYRYHRLAGSLVSSAEPMEEVRPLIPREAPRGQAQGPPLPLRDLAYGRMLGEGHFMLHLPP
ncbi:hypothetical protein KIL84_010268 [Mauremys mutica]|uniref:Uncharacterized protein n=1 Tax=Mauremys mutica TaxID=74926 RepID=A0A9D3XJA3_9SAUR|nr:hypothetical protein KIL84_010268 [Mauremys mutica]